MLLRTLLELLQGWRPAFSQSRSHRRAVAQALGILTSFGRRTLSRAIYAAQVSPEKVCLDCARGPRRPALPGALGARRAMAALAFGPTRWPGPTT
jgi:hypothetical protein